MWFNVEHIPSRLNVRRQIIALGADTRQRISWSAPNGIYSLFPKKDFSDLKEFYSKACKAAKNKFQVDPSAMAFDPHPYFICQKEAEALRDAYFPRARLAPVFHHKAHVASLGIQAGKNKKFIGLAFDGTGFGEDGRIWGSEFFVYSGACFKRAAHFDYLALPGSESAIRQPWRVAFAILYKNYGRKIFDARFDFLKGIAKDKLKLVAAMLDKDFNIAYASSAGRLFDAVAAMLNVSTVIKQEAEAAIALEKSASIACGQVVPYFFDCFDKKDGLCVSFSRMFEEMAEDANCLDKRNTSARRFHLTVALAIGRVCRMLRDKYSIKTVYASGGVFMNNILTQDIKKILAEDGFNVVMAARPVTTDIGISQGQIAALEMESNKTYLAL